MKDHSTTELALIAESMSQPPDQRATWILRRKAEIAQGAPAPKPYQPEGFTAKPFAEVADDPTIARLCAEDNR